MIYDHTTRSRSDGNFPAQPDSYRSVCYERMDDNTDELFGICKPNGLANAKDLLITRGKDVNYVHVIMPSTAATAPEGHPAPCKPTAWK